MNPTPDAILVRASILHFLADPGEQGDASAWAHFPDGALFIQSGRVQKCGDWRTVLEALPTLTRDSARYFDYRGKLLMPGFVDTHVHYPQLRVMGSWGRQLLDWLNDYTFPAEKSLADIEVARKTASFFLDRLLAHGTTTASVFATVHPHSVDVFFEEAQKRNLRMLCGKVMMDRNCPPDLRDTAEDSLRDGHALIERWHGKGRLGYSVTPRFAPTSTSGQLQAAAELFRSRPGMHLQSHLSENHGEMAWVRELFPDCRDYLDVYESHGLVGRGAIYGHGIHLSPAEMARLAESETAIAFCPTSNLFLGSGFCAHADLMRAGVSLGLATDVGGGSSLSMLRTMAAAYEVGQAGGQTLSAWRAWYMATLGAARALALDEHIGSFLPGREADFVVLDPQAIPELAYRTGFAESLEEQLFALMMLGDDRCIAATHIMGERVWQSGTHRSDPLAAPAVR
ncbi:guanine deaminase [Uliginosibacterium paludis]|uniref:Guanine deaminase n=1 Tax=Uliginosibacterium paludis TaxID=1615952 RepID=A0ABV2CLV2_9RHOO